MKGDLSKDEVKRARLTGNWEFFAQINCEGESERIRRALRRAGLTVAQWSRPYICGYTSAGPVKTSRKVADGWDFYLDTTTHPSRFVVACDLFSKCAPHSEQDRVREVLKRLGYRIFRERRLEFTVAIFNLY